MEKIYTGKEYAEELIYIYHNFDTFYAWGAFGAPADYGKNRERYKVPSAPSGSFLFDCSGFAYKAVPWGWNGEDSRPYGGAIYKMKGYEALETNDILSICDDVSEDWSHVEDGEVVYLPGHVGIYIGDNKVIECTSAWENGVMITTCFNTSGGSLEGLAHGRTWTKHGKLPFCKYEAEDGSSSDDLKETEKDILMEVDFGITNLEAAKEQLKKAQDHFEAAMVNVNNAIVAFNDLDEMIEKFFGGLKG